MHRERRLGWLLLAPILAAVAFSWVRIVAETRDVPADEDYVAAGHILRDQGFDSARDALVILPAWSLRPLAALASFDPISGDAISHQPLHRYARLWAVVEPDAGAEHEALVARRGAPLLRMSAGRLAIERFDLPPPSVTFDFAAHLELAAVSLHGSSGDVPCDRQLRRGVACSDKAWQRVTREWALVSENGDRVVWSHPPPRGQRLEIRWPAVPMGDSVVIRAGFTREGADRAKAPVRLQLWVDDELAGTVTRKPAFSFHTDIVDTARFAGKNAAVRFVIETDDDTGAHFAWDATAVGTP